MTSLEQLLRQVPQAATAATTTAFRPQEQQQQQPHHPSARRRSASSALMSGSIPVPTTLRRADFLGRGRHSSSSSSDEQDDADGSGALKYTGDGHPDIRTFGRLDNKWGREATGVGGAPQSASYFRPRTFEDYTRYFEYGR